MDDNSHNTHPVRRIWRIADGKEMAWEEIEVGLGSEDILLTNRLKQIEIIREEFSPQGGEPGELLWLDKSIQYIVYYISAADLSSLAYDLVQAQYQDGSYKPDLDSIQLQSSPPEKLSDGDYQLDIQVSWVDSQTVQKEEISDLISGKPLEQAEQILHDHLDLEMVPQISLQPGWWPRIPALPFRIQVIQGGN